MKIIVMGNGAFGSAIMSLLKENRLPATFWEGERLPPHAVIIGAIPTQFIRETLEKSRGTKNITYINCAKGIEQKTHKLPFEIVSEVLEKPDYFTLIGPSFAEEVKQKMPTLVNLGYENEKQLKKIKKLFQTDYFRVRLTKSIYPLELSAAFKNIYAIACGITYGLGFGMNTRVKIICLAMEELSLLREALGYKVDGNALPAIMGDLILTCNSEESRNFRFGKLLVSNSVEKTLKLVGHIIEGYYTVESVPFFEKKLDVSLPLAHFVHDVTRKKLSNNLEKRFTEFVRSI